MNVVAPFEGIGASVQPQGGPPLPPGRGHYTDDINRPGQTYA